MAGACEVATWDVAGDFLVGGEMVPGGFPVPQLLAAYWARFVHQGKGNFLEWLDVKVLSIAVCG